jgi:hypothetical protein
MEALSLAVDDSTQSCSSCAETARERDEARAQLAALREWAARAAASAAGAAEWAAEWAAEAAAADRIAASVLDAIKREIEAQCEIGRLRAEVKP